MMDNTPTGKLVRNVMLAFVEFERDMIVERTGEGKAITRQTAEVWQGATEPCYGAFGESFLQRGIGNDGHQ